MVIDDKQRIIGQITNINTNQCFVELKQNLRNFITSGFDDIHKFAQINSYVIIPIQNHYAVGEILGIREKDSTIREAQQEDTISSNNSIEISLIGELKRSGNDLKFEFGIATYPLLYSNVLYIKDNELDAIFNKSNVHGDIKIGESTVFPDYHIKINPTLFFGKHAAILGNTGSGKSCTISSILQSLFQDQNPFGSTFIIFDTNGEYLNSLEKLNNMDIGVEFLTTDTLSLKKKTDQYAKEDIKHVTTEELKLPHWFLSIDEWALLLKASDRVQLPVLRTALNFARHFNTNGEQKAAYTNHILSVAIKKTFTLGQGSAGNFQAIYSLLEKYKTQDLSPDLLKEYGVNFKFGTTERHDELIAKLDEFIIDEFKTNDFTNSEYFKIEELEEIINLAILYESGHGNENIQNYCAPLVTRIKDIVTRKEFTFLKSSEILLKTYLMKILGLESNNKKLTKKHQIIIIDMSSIQTEGAEVLISVLSRLVFELLHDAQERNKFPINIIVEEAHRYISEHQENYFQAQKIFERIAKEGRKFGLSLLISSQRPSEISKTVLSQCSNFIIHRIMNPDDLVYIRRVAPYISQTILDKLPYLPKQHALIFGDAITIPMTFKVREAIPRPRSDDSQVEAHWFIPKGSNMTGLELN